MINLITKTELILSTGSGTETYTCLHPVLSRPDIEYTKTELPRFGFTHKISSKIGVIKEDYVKVREHIEFNECTPIGVRRYRECNGVWVKIFDGVAFPIKSEIDLDRCVIRLECEEYSPYKCLDENWEVERNYLREMPLPEKKADAFSLIKRYKVHIINNTDTDGPIDVTVKRAYDMGSGSYTFDEIIGYIGSEIPIGSPLHTLLIGIADANIDKFIRYTDDRFITPMGAGFPRIIANKDWYFVINEFPGGLIEIAERGDMTYSHNYTDPDPTIPGEPWSEHIRQDYDFVGLYRANYLIPNGRSLQDVFEAYLDYACPSLTVRSNFLQWNPSVPSSTNYVTGRTNELTNLLIFQKSDVKRPTDASKATAGTTTLKWLLETICKTFECWYRIVGNVLEIEHCSHFRNMTTGTLYLTDPDHEFYARGTNRYSYDYAQIPKREMFKNMEAFGLDFVGMPIEYPQECAGIERKEDEIISTERLTTDVIACVDGEPSWFSNEEVSGTDAEKREKRQAIIDKYISDDGFVIMACSNTEVAGYYPVHISAGILGPSRSNNLLSWAHLHKDYYQPGYRYLPTGRVNGVDVLFVPRKYKIQEMKFLDCCGDFDPQQKIITQLSSDGRVEEATLDTVTGLVNLKIRH